MRVRVGERQWRFSARIAGEGAVMFLKKRQRVVEHAVLATMEDLEQRKLLTTCDPVSAGLLKVFGNNSTANNIVVSYNSGNGDVSVSDSVAGGDCRLTNACRLSQGGTFR